MKTHPDVDQLPRSMTSKFICAEQSFLIGADNFSRDRQPISLNQQSDQRCSNYLLLTQNSSRNPGLFVKD